MAIALNIREPEATKFYREYWRLNQLYDLDQICEETKENFSSLIELYRQMKAADMNVAHVIRLLNMANTDIQSIEYLYQKLRREADSLEARNRNAAITFQQLSDCISDEHKTLDQYRLFCKEQKQEIDKLLITKTRLEEFIEYFQGNNEVYLKIKEVIKQEIKFILTEPRQLLKIGSHIFN